MKEARLPMGLRKDLHIKAITEIPDVRDRWHSVYGKYPDQGEFENRTNKKVSWHDTFTASTHTLNDTSCDHKMLEAFEWPSGHRANLDDEFPGSNPAGDGMQPMTLQRFISQSHSLSAFLRVDVT